MLTHNVGERRITSIYKDYHWIVIWEDTLITEKDEDTDTELGIRSERDIRKNQDGISWNPVFLTHLVSSQDTW